METANLIRYSPFESRPGIQHVRLGEPRESLRGSGSQFGSLTSQLSHGTLETMNTGQSLVLFPLPQSYPRSFLTVPSRRLHVVVADQERQVLCIQTAAVLHHERHKQSQQSQFLSITRSQQSLRLRLITLSRLIYPLSLEFSDINCTVNHQLFLPEPDTP